MLTTCCLFRDSSFQPCQQRASFTLTHKFIQQSISTCNIPVVRCLVTMEKLLHSFYSENQVVFTLFFFKPYLYRLASYGQPNLTLNSRLFFGSPQVPVFITQNYMDAGEEQKSRQFNVVGSMVYETRVLDPAQPNNLMYRQH